MNMKSTKFIAILILSSTLMYSCGEAESEEVENELTEENESNISDLEMIDFDEVDMSAGMDDYLMTCINVHNEVNPIELPHTEKTGFDTWDPYFPLTGEEILAFRLDTLGVDTNMFVNLDYWVDLSPDYSTYVFNVEKTEHEISTYMVTYFGDYTFIDSKEIAYDEIAESATRIESKIEKDKITIDYLSYWDGEEKDTKVFFIDENGNFQEK
jgi:hypothetical protein